MMIKVYNLRVTGPSTNGDDVQLTELPLDNVVTALLLLDIGDSAVIDCTGEQVDA